MPINEAALFQYSRLTSEQKRQEEEALFGLQREETVSEAGKVNIIDINNPPVPQYIHQEFPKLVYRKPKKNESALEASKTVRNEAELEAALKGGFQKKPFVVAE